MLFNSQVFLLAFLPATLLLFFGLKRSRFGALAIPALVGASLVFYAYWNPVFLPLLLGSILFNYGVSRVLVRRAGGAGAKGLLLVGIAANLGCLGWFKYSYFAAENIRDATGLDFVLPEVGLPLAISFFTFQQITYLVDAWKGEAREYDFVNYCLFVTFFPQLIAGPIVHHKEIMPQFERERGQALNLENLAVGLTIFAVGLFKKVVIADSLSPDVAAGFNAAQMDGALPFFSAWQSTLAYMGQIYFDFSGYSDMAVGLARMFGIRLPINFNSPYKSTSMAELWQRWHITLSRFLRDYVFQPLGGMRRERWRRYTNLSITMILCGIWHGAGWNFVVFGIMQAVFVVTNHIWREAKRRLGFRRRGATRLGTFAAWGLTMLCWVASCAMFRAPDVTTGLTMMEGMIGLHGFDFANLLPAGVAAQLGAWAQTLGLALADPPVYHKVGWLTVTAALLVAFLCPNVYEFMARQDPVQGFRPRLPEGWMARLAWQPQPAFAVLAGVLISIALLRIAAPSEFLYFQF